MPAMIRFQSRLAGKHWPEADLMILAHRLASRPDPFGQNLTRPSRSDPGQFCTGFCGKTAEMDAGSWILSGMFTGKTHTVQFLTLCKRGLSTCIKACVKIF